MLFSFAPMSLAEDSTDNSGEDATTEEDSSTGSEDPADEDAEDDASTEAEENSDDESDDEEDEESDVEDGDEKKMKKPRVRKDFKDMFALPDDEDAKRTAFFTMLQWGYIDEVGEDAAELNWSIEVSVDDGKVQLMGDELLFEGIDKLDEQTAVGTLGGITQTTSHWDGMIIKVTPNSRDEGNKVHVKIGEFAKDYTLSELFETHGIYDLTNGRQVAIRSFHRGAHLGWEEREGHFNKKLAVIKRVEKIHEKVRKLIEDGKIDDKMAGSIFDVLKRLENHEYSAENDVKWVKRLSDLVIKLEQTTDKLEEVLVDEVATVNGEFEDSCEKTTKDDFKEGLVPFEDTSQCTWFTDSVRRLKDANVVRGMKGTNNFAPANNISRAELLAIGLASAGVDVDQVEDSELGETTFADTKGHWAEKGIRYALKNGLVKGFEDGFRPNHQITRAEALAMVYKVFGLKANDECTATFKDVEGHWGKCIMEDAKLIGVVNGFDDGTFKPNDPITRAAMAKIVSNMVDYVKQLADHEEL